MRVFPPALRGLAYAGTLHLAALPLVALSLAVSSAALAIPTEPQTAASIQIQLVEARQRLNALYDQAAAASERLNGAVYETQLANAEAARNVRAVSSARKDLSRERASVAALTVQDLQSGTGMSRLGALFTSAGPAQLLDRSAAYVSTQEAMAARIDALSASTVVYRSAINRAVEAATRQRQAVANQIEARAAIHSAIARAEAAVQDTTSERAGLLTRLAKVQGVPLADVSDRQDQIDQALDARPRTPLTQDPPDSNTGGSTGGPAPDKPKSTTPAPTTPKPAVPPVVDPPPASSNKVETAISFAQAQLGDPYKWGGTGPNSWDCSGLTMKAWAAAGISLPHFGGAQYTSTKAVSVSKIQRGDLLFWSDGSAGSIYHVAMYLGGGQMIHAPRTGRDVEIVPLTYWIRPDLASRPG